MNDVNPNMQSLSISPKILHFPLSNKKAKYCTLFLKLHNINQESIVAFKILSKKAERYIVNPNTGLINPNEEIQIYIVLNYEKLDENIEEIKGGRDRFQILSFPIKNSNYASPQQIFHKSNDKITKQYIKCKFVSSEIGFSPIKPSTPNTPSTTSPLFHLSPRERELEKRVEELERKEKQLQFNLKQALTLRDRVPHDSSPNKNNDSLNINNNSNKSNF
eukprot:TRINITY_DN12883_c0_g1_i1.p1 TRINITY_DN12883_c0_g1~~TRINITY_DN12883_c0_g1_i1.p1  ORF type:complete len:219 (-),score=62.07 TRINITY_DN12883_c0_g1_i1:130-786(-)